MLFTKHHLIVDSEELAILKTLVEEAIEDSEEGRYQEKLIKMFDELNV